MNRGHKQADLIIMDFIKAFDKVPHMRLLYKLNYYGIRESTYKLISSWLWAQPTSSLGQVWCLIVSIPDLCPFSYLDGQASDPVIVLFGVHQDVGVRTDSLFKRLQFACSRTTMS